MAEKLVVNWEKLTVQWHSINYTEYWLLMLRKQQSFENKNAIFSDFFLSRWWPVDTLTDATMCKRHQGSTRQTENVSHKAACRQLNE